MIKFTASGNGVTLIGLGLEPGNIDRMQRGQPVRVKLSDLGFVGAVGAVQILIFTGVSREAMEQAVTPFIGADTVVHRS